MGLYTYNVPDKQTGKVPTWKATSGKEYKRVLHSLCGEDELECPVCGGCSYCGPICIECADDFEEYLRLYFEAYGVEEEDIIKGIKEWKEKVSGRNKSNA